MQVLPITTTPYGVNKTNFKGKAVMDSYCKKLYETCKSFRDAVNHAESVECGDFHIVKGGTRSGWDEHLTDIIKVDHSGESSIMGRENYCYGSSDYYAK